MQDSTYLSVKRGRRIGGRRAMVIHFMESIKLQESTDLLSSSWLHLVSPPQKPRRDVSITSFLVDNLCRFEELSQVFLAFALLYCCLFDFMRQVVEHLKTAPRLDQKVMMLLRRMQIDMDT